LLLLSNHSATYAAPFYRLVPCRLPHASAALLLLPHASAALLLLLLLLLSNHSATYAAPSYWLVPGRKPHASAALLLLLPPALLLRSHLQTHPHQTPLHWHRPQVQQ
jgi:hypothetical protein